jgi:cell division protein FtsB
MNQLKYILAQPLKVAVAALAIAVASLLTEGSFTSLWNLKQEKTRLLRTQELVSAKNTELRSMIQKAQNSDSFIGHQARERLDLAGEDELVFIFDN